MKKLDAKSTNLRPVVGKPYVTKRHLLTAHFAFSSLTGTGDRVKKLFDNSYFDLTHNAISVPSWPK